MVEKGVKEYFNISEEYFLNRGPTVTLVEKLEENWFKKHMTINSEEALLDYACGLGRWSVKLKNNFHKIIAIDISPKLINALKRKKYHNIKPIVGSDEQLSRYNNAFNKIIFAQGLEFYKNPVMLLKKFRSSLKPNGELFLSTWTPELIEGIDGLELKKSYVVTSRQIDNKKIKVFCELRTISEVKMLLKKAGFTKIIIETICINTSKLSKEIKNLFGLKFQKQRNIDILIVVKASK